MILGHSQCQLHADPAGAKNKSGLTAAQLMKESRMWSGEKLEYLQSFEKNGDGIAKVQRARNRPYKTGNGQGARCVTIAELPSLEL